MKKTQSKNKNLIKNYNSPIMKKATLREVLIKL